MLAVEVAALSGFEERCWSESESLGSELLGVCFRMCSFFERGSWSESELLWDEYDDVPDETTIFRLLSGLGADWSEAASEPLEESEDAIAFRLLSSFSRALRFLLRFRICRGCSPICGFRLFLL